MLFLSIILCGQTRKHVTLTFSIDDFVLKGKECGLHIFPKKYPYIYKDDIRQPALPYIGMDVPIGMDDEFVTVSYDEHEINVKKNVTIEYNPQIVSTSAPNKLVHSPKQSGKAINISNSIEFSGSYIKQGTKYLSFVICPFRYDLSTKDLYLRDIFNLDIILSHTTKPTIPPQRNSVNITSISEPYKYVIVTSNALKSAFEKLAIWKTQKGIRTKILTTEYIDSVYSGDSLQLKIKNAIYDYRLDGMEYALLGGDIDIVPARLCESPFTTDETISNAELAKEWICPLTYIIHVSTTILNGIIMVIIYMGKGMIISI